MRKGVKGHTKEFYEQRINIYYKIITSLATLLPKLIEIRTKLYPYNYKDEGCIGSKCTISGGKI